MTALQAISEYFKYQFQGLKRCQFQYEPNSQTLQVYCSSHREREKLLRYAEAIAQLDIGVARFVLTAPHTMDIVIDSQSTPGHQFF